MQVAHVSKVVFGMKLKGKAFYFTAIEIIINDDHLSKSSLTGGGS